MRFRNSRSLRLQIWLLSATVWCLLTVSSVLSPAFSATRVPAPRESSQTDTRIYSYVQTDRNYLTLLARPAFPTGTSLTASFSRDEIVVSSSSSGQPVQLSDALSADVVVKKHVYVVVASGRLDASRLQDLDSVTEVLRDRLGGSAVFRLTRMSPGQNGDWSTAGNSSCIPLMSGCRTDDAVESALNGVIAAMNDGTSENPASGVVKDLILVSDGMTGDATRFATVSPADLVSFEENTRLIVDKTAADIRKYRINLFVLPLTGTDAVGMARLRGLAVPAGGMLVVPEGDLPDQAMWLAETISGGSLVRIPIRPATDADILPGRVVFADVDTFAGESVVEIPRSAVTAPSEANPLLVPVLLSVVAGCALAVALVVVLRRSGQSSKRKRKWARF